MTDKAKRIVAGIRKQAGTVKEKKPAQGKPAVDTLKKWGSWGTGDDFTLNADIDYDSRPEAEAMPTTDDVRIDRSDMNVTAPKTEFVHKTPPAPALYDRKKPSLGDDAGDVGLELPSAQAPQKPGGILSYLPKSTLGRLGLAGALGLGAYGGYQMLKDDDEEEEEDA